MKELQSADIRLLLDTIAKLNSETRERSISERVLTAVQDLVPSDLIALDSFSLDDHIFPPIHWNNNFEMLTPETEEICSAVFEESPGDNPLIAELVHKGSDKVLKLSDFSDLSRFRESAYYNEVMRRVGFDRQMAAMLPLAMDVSFSCAVQRKGVDFSERERQLLTAIVPHLSNAIDETIVREEALRRNARLEEVLEGVSRGMLVIGPGEGIVQITGFARRILDQYFSEYDHKRLMLPSELAEWVRLCVDDDREMTVSREGSTVNIRLSRNISGVDSVLIFEERLKIGPEVFERIQLTPRQSEILYWMWKGKTYGVISELLDVSRRTVEKHVQLIFERLGVETRTAAVAVAVQRLQLSATHSEDAHGNRHYH